MKSNSILPDENKRILVVIEEKTGGNQLEFSREIGISQPRINRLFTANDKLANTDFPLPSFGIIQSIAKRYRDINLDWLITGEGEMNKKDKVNNEVLINLSDELEAAKVQIKLLQTLCDTQIKLISKLEAE